VDGPGKFDAKSQLSALPHRSIMLPVATFGTQAGGGGEEEARTSDGLQQPFDYIKRWSSMSE